jgi:hypothetical protein
MLDGSTEDAGSKEQEIEDMRLRMNGNAVKERGDARKKRER